MNSQQNSQNWQKESKVSRFLCEKGHRLKKSIPQLVVAVVTNISYVHLLLGPCAIGLLPTGTTWAPTFVPHNAWTLSSRQRQIQTQCKKANTNWPTAPPPIYLVLQHSLEANQDRRSISHNAMSSVSISVGFETTTMANNVSQRTKGCN